MTHGQPKVLLIEDETSYRRTVKAYLEDSGYTVVEVADGREGIELISREAPDVVICDLRMPVLDAFGVLDHVKAHHGSLPVIVITGTGNMANSAVAHGAFRRLRKPIADIRDLEDAVSTALERGAAG